MVKNIYLDTKINLVRCQGAELLLEVALDPVVGIVGGVGVHCAVLKPVPINSAWSKTYIWTLRSTFYDARELSYTISQISGFRGHFQGFRVIFGGLRTSKKLHQTWFHVGLGVLKPFQSENLVYKTIFYLHHITHCIM